MRPLYKDKPLRKTAAFAGRLSEAPENWPMELQSDMFKQLPYLSDYDVNVNLDRVDAERGYAFGYGDIHNRTERPEEEHDEAGLPHIRVPVIVRERMVKPFSVFMDGERVLPLNEDRVREALFNPSTFDLSTNPPVDPSLVEPLMPPHRSGIGMGGDYKLASADERLLAELQGVKTKTAKMSDEDRELRSERRSAYATLGTAGGAIGGGLGGHLANQHSGGRTSLVPGIVGGALGGGVGGYLHARHSEKKYKRFQEKEKTSVSDAWVLDKLKNVEKAAPGRVGKFKEHLKQLNTTARDKVYSNTRAEHRRWMARGVAGGRLTKLSFKHISQEQWQAIYNSLEVQKLVHEYGSRSHPAVQNKVYEIATKMYGYHPKPEPAPPQKMQEFKQKLMEKKQKETQKQIEKGQKQMQEGQQALQKAQGAKTAGVEESLLLKIAPTVREADRAAFFQKLASSPELVAGFKRSGIWPIIFEFGQETEKLASASDRLLALAENIDPTVVTVMKLPGGSFLVKSANVDAFAPDQAAQGEMVPPEEAGDALGEDQAQAMEPGQIASAVDEPVPSTEPEVPASDVIDRFGEYLVQDMMGNQIMGWVFPSTMAWDGNFQEQPLALFTNGSSFAIQDSVAGEMIGKSTSLPMSTPRGEGVFYEVTRAGARSTAPVTVRGGLTGPDGGEMYHCQDFMGNEFQVHMSPELVQPQRVSDTEYALPATWKFMTLNGQTQLVPDPVQMNKTGAVKLAASSVDLFWNGSFNLEGGCGLNKIASKFRYDLDAVSAEFMLGLLGVNGADIKEKLSQARKLGSIKLANLKTITTLAERYQEKQKTAQTLALRIPDLKRDLLKEAAALEDESTVDKVLALNFVNPENLSTFLEYIPELEQTSEKLAEMLLSGFLGMEQIPEGAVERAMKNMEEVVLALKAVAHAEG